MFAARRTRARRAVLLAAALAMVASTAPLQAATPLADAYGYLGLKPKKAKPAPAADNRPAGSWIVVLRDGTDPDTVANAIGATPKEKYTSALSGFSADLTVAQLQALDANSGVMSLNEDREIGRIEPLSQAHAKKAEAAANSRHGGSSGCDQPVPLGHPAQLVPFSIERVGTLLSKTADIDCSLPPSSPAVGPSVKSRPEVDVDVAIVDSGVSTHLDLNIVGGADCAAGNGFDDVVGHGSAVAGVSAAKDNSFGVVGVAPGARLWSVRVTDPDGSISQSNLLCAYDWLRRHAYTIDVANISILGPGANTADCGLSHRRLVPIAVNFPPILDRLLRGRVIDPEHLALCRVIAAGVTVVAAAGNETQDAGNVIPAAYPEVITVSAIADSDGLPGGLGDTPTCPDGPGELDDHLATFSNFGAAVDIAAPGVCILTTFVGNLYIRLSGTSFAAPHVAGAAALLKAKHPGWTPAQVKKQILKTAEPGPIPGDPDAFPEGVLDVSTF